MSPMTETTASGRPLRLRPGIAIAVLQLLIMVGGVLFAPDEAMIFVLGGGIIGALATIVWWVGFSRAPWYERVGAIALMPFVVLATKQVVDASISGAGMGMLIYVLPLPLLSLALVAWAAATRHLQDPVRRAAWLVVAFVLGAVPCTLIRTAGIRNGATAELHWRWTPTPEQRLLAQADEEPAVVPPAAPIVATPGAAPVAANSTAEATAPPAVSPASSEDGGVPAAAVVSAEWPGFRGPHRDDVVHGVSIETDWSRSPPVEMWRRPIGPGWSSFAVRGDFLYTQEQRGEEELVACYRVSSGAPVWRHRDRVRFYESNGGPGPRATPTISNNRIYTFGATGVLNALDAGSGTVVWSRNATSDTGRGIPDWGRTSSPLVVDEVVIVNAGLLVAYDTATGKLRWMGPGAGGYSSPQLVTIDGVPQVLMLGTSGATSVAPADGKVLWTHDWPGGSIVQPAVTENGDVLVNSVSLAGGTGLRRLAIAHGAGGWTATERWTSTGLKPYFNDFVVHKGHAYGFDGNILSSIDLEDGKRTWKGGRYGFGQLLLLADEDLLLVLSEDGELALVRATPEQFTEVARFTALAAKTWNHPVVVGDILLVRNGEEMAAFRLPMTGR